ncbi:unnamed protein product [Moneuplotes crassus]|uniref:Alpha/beta hydrolase fold-3 domain-containing protein n=1 Tax=Euplotes crassus TaxID=5936 RepID=A0AAD1X336_EUPCR|nr:unnamed protein product [Moneuplotes crassus]
MEKLEFSQPKIPTVDIDKKIEKFYDQHDGASDPTILGQRIHYPFRYTFKTDKKELLSLLRTSNKVLKEFDDDLTKLLNEKHPIFLTYEEELKQVDARIRNMELLIVVCIINICENSIDDIIYEESTYGLKKHLFEAIDEIKNDIPYFSVNSEVENYALREAEININAVYCVCLALVKQSWLTMMSMANLKDQDDKHTRRDLLYVSFKLAAFFDFLYSALLVPKDCVFWDTEPTPEVEKMLRCYEYRDPENIEEHLEATKKKLESFDLTIAVASKGFRSGSMFKQLFDGVRFLIKYKKDKDRAKTQSQFFMTVLQEKTILRMMRFTETDLVKTQIRRGLDPIAVDKKIYIPFSEGDLLTEDNLDDDTCPIMIQEDLEMKCKFSKKKYDPTKSVKVRIVSGVDWMGVNWKKKKLVDPDMEPIEVKAVMIHIHGGGFLGGSSSSSRSTTFRWSEKLGIPLFSIDYRLSPDYKFPDALNDCWQAYLWILKYSERYLKLKPLKIIVNGDSAGGNLCIGIINLAIQKNVKMPDFGFIIYPSLRISPVHLVPSFLLSCDDQLLNSTFLKLVLQSYPTDYMRDNEHYLLSPGITPDSMVSRYPPMRFLIAGLDPLRDDQIQFMMKMASCEIDVKAIEYRYLVHAFLGQANDPEGVEEAKKAEEQGLEWVQEFIDDLPDTA